MKLSLSILLISTISIVFISCQGEEQQKDKSLIEIHLNDQDQIFLNGEPLGEGNSPIEIQIDDQDGAIPNDGIIQISNFPFFIYLQELIRERDEKDPGLLLKVRYSYDENATLGKIQEIYNSFTQEKNGIIYFIKAPNDSDYTRINDEDLVIPRSPVLSETEKANLLELELVSSSAFYAGNEMHILPELEDILLNFFKAKSQEH